MHKFAILKSSFLRPNFSRLAAFLPSFAPVPLPPSYQKRTFRFGAFWQIAIALMLNILSLAVPVMMLQVYDRIIPHRSYGTLAVLTACVLVALAADATLRLLRAWLSGWAAASQDHAAGLVALARLMRARLPAAGERSDSDYIQAFAALGRLREFYSGQAMSALVDLPFVALFLGLIAYLGGWLVLVPAALLFLFAAAAQVSGRRLRATLSQRAKADEGKAAIVLPMLRAMHTLKAISAEIPMLRRFEARQADVTNESFHVALAGGQAATLGAAFAQASLILTAAFGAAFVIDGRLSVGGLSACTLLAGRAIQPVQRVLGTWMRLQDLDLARAQVQPLFTLPVQKRAAATDHLLSDGRLTLRGVSFAYMPGKEFLHAIDLDVATGEVIAISGPKGAGKTTLLKLMAGLLEPDSGTILADGRNPAAFGLGRMKGSLGYMPQNGGLFDGTVMDNLTGFRTDARAVENARRAAMEFGLDAVLNRSPAGYRTVLLDRPGDTLPPGVKQRIALSRVLADRPRILLFDEADRALDKEGYNRLFRIMGRLKGSCTLIMVSQDQNLLSFADRFYTLQDGRLRTAPAPRAAARSIFSLPHKDV